MVLCARHGAWREMRFEKARTYAQTMAREDRNTATGLQCIGRA